MTVEAYTSSQENNKKKDNEVFQQARLTMVKAHMKAVQFNVFRQQIKEKVTDPKVKGYLELLAVISALDELLSDSGAIYDTGYFAPGSLKAMQDTFSDCVKDLRP